MLDRHDRPLRVRRQRRQRHAQRLLGGRDGSLGLLAPDGVSATTGPGPIDVAAADGVLYVENGGDGSLSGYAVGADGALTPVGTVTGLTPDGGTGIEGLVAI